MNKKVLILAYASLNLGDDLFIKILCDRYPKTDFILMTNKKYSKAFSEIKNLKIIFQIPKIDGIFNSLKIPFQLNLYRQYLLVKKVDAVVQIGGSIFIENKNWEARFNSLMKIASEDVPYFIIGANFGPYITPKFLSSYDKLFNLVDDVCFRDDYSYQLFKSNKKIRTAPDVVLSLEPKIGDEKITPGYVFSIINLENRQNLSSYTGIYEETIIETVQELISKNKKCTLVSFCESEGDLIAIKRIIGKFQDHPKKELVSLYNYDGDMTQILNLLSQSEAILATRFHSVILSLVFEKNFFPVIYSNKTKHFLEDIDYELMLGDIKTFEKITIDNILESLLSDRKDDYRSIKKKAQEQFHALDTFLL